MIANYASGFAHCSVGPLVARWGVLGSQLAEGMIGLPSQSGGHGCMAGTNGVCAPTATEHMS